MSTINNYTEGKSNHPKKVEIRADIIETLKTLKVNTKSRILTLPHLNFDIERKALELGFKVNSVEINEDTFGKQILLRSQMPSKLIFEGKQRRFNLARKSLSEYLDEYKIQKFDFVYLDFCSQYCKEIQDCVNHLQNRCPIIYITVLCSRVCANYKHLFKSNDRIKDFIEVFKHYGYTTEKYFQYTNGKSPMCTFKLVKTLPTKIRKSKKIMSLGYFN